MPLKPTLVEGVDVDVVNGIATDARTVTAGRCLCHKHNDSASCLGVTMHATDCMQAWATVRIVAALRRVALAHALTLVPLTGNSTQLATPLKETRARSSAGQRAPDTNVSSVSQLVSDLSAVARKRVATEKGDGMR